MKFSDFYDYFSLDYCNIRAKSNLSYDFGKFRMIMKKKTAATEFRNCYVVIKTISDETRFDFRSIF